MMADFVVPRHNAVMERLRRRIELFRRHHNSCENRYESTALERLELERQQTLALHQRCLQTKAKRSNKHRQTQQSSDQTVQRGPGTGVGNADIGDSGTPGEQSRNSTLIALQETVKRKLESAHSPLSRDQVNGFSDGFPPSKKACLDNGTANGIPPHSPMDTKHSISAANLVDSLVSNGTHGPGGESADGGMTEQEFRLKEMKQEPVDDILPCMLPSGGGGNNSFFPDLNFNEQEWTELMEELNSSVAYEDIQDILNDGFEDRKDPPDLAPTPTSGPGVGSAGGGSGGSQVPPGQLSQGILPPDLASIKAEFSPASAAFEQDSRTGSPHVRPTSSGPPVHPTNSPAATSTASSPALPQPQQPLQPQSSRQLQPPNHLLPPGPPVSKDLSPAQQLQQMAAQQRAQQRAQQQQQTQKQQQQTAKFHLQGSHPHPPSWPQSANPSPSSLGGAFGMDKPSSPSLYPQDFNPNNPKQLMMPGQPNKGSPKAGAGPYLQGPQPNMLGHPAAGSPLSHPAAAGGQAPASMLNYNNTKPLSHFEAAGPGAGPPRGPPKAALLSFLRQQQMKQKAGMPFRPHLPLAQQDQSAYPAPPHGPGSSNAMATQPGGNTMATAHNNPAYLSGVAAAMKQQQQQQQIQMLEQQKQYLIGQRQQQQMMAEQEKQRQEQQLQRHLTRPPPQYKDVPGQAATQNHFQQQQQQVNQFSGSSQSMGGVGAMGGPAATSQRMFPQNQGMMGLNMGQAGGPAGGVVPPTAASQAEMSLSSCGAGPGMDVPQVLYSNMNMHPSHPGHQPHPSQQGAMQRQPVGGMNANYRQNLLAQQQHLKNQPNAALLKQQQLAAAAAAARLPVSLPNTIGATMPSAMPGAMQSSQSPAWQQPQQQHQGIQQAMGSQPPSSNGGMPPNAFTNPNAFHMQQQQTRMPKMPTGSAPFGANPNGRPMSGMNPRQQMMQSNMAAQQRAASNPQALGQALGQPLANQQPQQAPQQQAAQNQVLPDLATFGQSQGNGRQGLQCNQGFQVNRTANQQQMSFSFNAASGTAGLPSFPGESDLVDSLLKGQSTQEWMDDLDELLASQH